MVVELDGGVVGRRTGGHSWANEVRVAVLGQSSPLRTSRIGEMAAFYEPDSWRKFTFTCRSLMTSRRVRNGWRLHLLPGGALGIACTS